MHLLVLGPPLTRPYRQEMEALGVTAREEATGIWSFRGGPAIHRMWVLETGALAGVEHPLLTLFSPQFLSQGPRTYNQLQQGGYTEMVVYFAQQIRQFERLGEEFAMQHLGTEEEMRQALLDLVASILREGTLTGPELRDLVATLPPKKLLAAVPPEQYLAALTPEQRLAGLTPEELEQVRQLLQTRKDKSDPSDPK